MHRLKLQQTQLEPQEQQTKQVLPIETTRNNKDKF